MMCCVQLGQNSHRKVFIVACNIYQLKKMKKAFRICQSKNTLIKGADVCLIDLWFSVPVNSYGHVGMLPPFYGTFTHY